MTVFVRRVVRGLIHGRKTHSHYKGDKIMNGYNYIDMLKERGFPQSELWRTECHKTNDLFKYYDSETVFDLDIKEPFVLYHHESGTITFIAGFHDAESFEMACKYLASAFA